MKTAIITLEIGLSTLETNEPIQRAEGKNQQADFSATGAAEIRQALAILKTAHAGPIWPVPARLIEMKKQQDNAAFQLWYDVAPPEKRLKAAIHGWEAARDSPGF